MFGVIQPISSDWLFGFVDFDYLESTETFISFRQYIL